VLGERRERSPNSPLNLIEVVTLIAVGDWERAFAAAENALEGAEEAGDRQGVMRSCVALAHLADRSEVRLSADELLERAGELAARLGDQDTRFGVLLQRLVLRRGAEEEDEQELEQVPGASTAALYEEAVGILDDLPDHTLKDDPELTRAAMAELGTVNAGVLQRGLRLVGLGHVEETDLNRLGSAIPSTPGDSLADLGFTLARTLEVPAAGSPPWHVILVKAPSVGRLEDFLDRILEEAPDAWDFLAAVADVARARTSWSLYLSVYATIAGRPGTGYYA